MYAESLFIEDIYISMLVGTAFICLVIHSINSVIKIHRLVNSVMKNYTYIDDIECNICYDKKIILLRNNGVGTCEQCNFLMCYFCYIKHKRVKDECPQCKYHIV